jgi:hypothetical protein
LSSTTFNIPPSHLQFKFKACWGLGSQLNFNHSPLQGKFKAWNSGIRLQELNRMQQEGMISYRPAGL